MLNKTKIKENHIPRLRFPGFDGEWGKATFSQFSKIKMGQSPDSKFYNSNGEGEFLIQGNADIDGRVSCPRNWTTQITKECDVGDILMTVRAPVGYVAISKHKAVIGRGICSMEALNNSDINFLYQYLLNYEKKWEKCSQGSTFTAVNSNEIKNLKVVFPTLPEQQKIASFLTSVDNWIENLRAQKKNLELYKKGMMQKIFSQEIRFRDENGNEFPEWEGKRLGDIFSISAGGDIEKIHVSKYKTDIFKYPIFANSDKNKGLYGYADIYKAEKDSITVTGRGNLGVAVARFEDFYPIVRLLILRPKKRLDIKFFEYCINRVHFFVESTGVPQLTGPQISIYKMFVPMFEEQQKVANFLISIDNLIENKQQQIASAEKWKKGLIQGLFV